MSRKSRIEAEKLERLKQKHKSERSPSASRPAPQELNYEKQIHAMHMFIQEHVQRITTILDTQREEEIKKPEATAQEQGFRNPETRTLSEMPVCAALAQISRELPVPKDFRVIRGEVHVDERIISPTGKASQPQWGVGHTYWIAQAPDPRNDLIACLTTGQFVLLKDNELAKGDRKSFLTQKAQQIGMASNIFPISEEVTLVCATRSQLAKLGLIYMDQRMENLTSRPARRK